MDPPIYLWRTANREWPQVNAVVPARDEANMLSLTLIGILEQGYPGPFHVYLVDDCALARLVKQTSDSGTASLWLGLTRDVRSLRPYRNISNVWSTIVRTAFAQLQYSPILLLVAVMGLVITYVVSPLGTLIGLALLVSGEHLNIGLVLTLIDVLAWCLMSASLMTMLQWYQVSSGYAILLPVTGILYILMIMDSAHRYWHKKGGAWIGRNYRAARP